MADITIQISGNALSALRAMPEKFEDAITGSLNDSNTYFLALMKRYPPTRPNQRYVRTGTLGRSWSARPVTRTANGWQSVVGSNGNMAPYNRQVQSRDEQGHWFVGRWRTAESAVEQSASQIQRFVDARIRTALAEV